MRIDYIGYALAIIGLIYAYYLYRKSIRAKEPVYSIRSSNLISDATSNFTDLVVSYRGQQVRNFTFSTVLFFNRGALTIDRTDIASLNPLRIVPKDCNILEASVFIRNKPSNGITLTADETRGGFRIDFEYLNQDDGAIFTILHDGVSSENLYVVGDMKEVRSLRRVSPSEMRVASRPNLRNVGTLLAIVWLVVMTLLYALLLSLPSLAQWWLYLWIFFVIIAGIGGHFLMVFFLHRSSKVVIPKGLEMFDE